MLSNILNIVGLLLIICSIYIISKDLKNNEEKKDELRSVEENIKQYYKYTKDIVSDFEKLIDLKLRDIESNNENIEEKNYTPANTNEKKVEKEKIYQTKSNTQNDNEDTKKIMELLEIGLTEEEIAKKLGKGIREVDIIIKMHKNKL